MIFSIWLKATMLASALLLCLNNMVFEDIVLCNQEALTNLPQVSPYIENNTQIPWLVELSFFGLLSPTGPQYASTVIAATTSDDRIVNWEASSNHGFINASGTTFYGSITEDFQYAINTEFDYDVITIIFYGYNADIRYTTEISVSKNEDGSYSLRQSKH